MSNPAHNGYIDKAKNTVSIKTFLAAYIQEEKPGMYVSYCPALDLYSQGDTLEEARKNIIEATELFIESCLEEETLAEVLTACGFHSVYKKSGKKPKPAPMPFDSVVQQFHFPAEIPMMATA